jgi:transglutaminase-like putative cysteine protease
MPILSIRHMTRYRYRNSVALGEHRMMFRPRESYDQRLLSSSLTITPTPTRLRSVQDVFGNCVQVAGFTGRTRELTFDSRVRLEHTPLAAFADIDGEVEHYTGQTPFAYDPQDLPDLLTSMERQYPDPAAEVDAWARRFVRPAGPTSLQTLLSDMTQAIYAEFQYRTRLTGGAQTPLETLASRSGSCRDYAVLMIEAVRSLGLAARFVSGYIYSPWSGAAAGGRVGSGHTHAWVRVYLPSCGWVEFDPTNGIVGNADLVRVAVARDPRQATPLYGAWFGDAADFIDMQVEVDVRAEPDTVVQLPPLRAVAIA